MTRHDTRGIPPPVRYFLALFPCGYYRIGVFRDGIARGCACLVAGELTPRFLTRPENAPLDAVVVTETREITRREARDIWAMRSPLVPTQTYLAMIGERRIAALRALPLYEAAGLAERAEMLRLRIARLTRRVERLVEAQARGWFAIRGQPVLHPVYSAPDHFRVVETGILAGYHGGAPFPVAAVIHAPGHA